VYTYQLYEYVTGCHTRYAQDKI